MKVYLGPSIEERWERILGYGGSKVGKTRLFTSLPDTPKWGEPLIYIATEPGSEFLKSVLHRKRCLVVKPGPEKEGDTWDPLKTYVQIATFPWRQHYPGARTIILDSGTHMSWDLLHAYADTGKVQAGHVSLGEKGTNTYHAAPDKSDFGAAQRSHGFILQHLWRQPMNLLVIYQQDWVAAKSGGLDELAGGPMTVGTATIRELPSLFDTVLHLVPSPEPGRGQVAVMSQQHGPWPAGIRHARVGGRMGTYILNDDPVHFWNDYDALVEEPTT